MSIQKKSLISTLKTAKKANVASGSTYEVDAKGAKVASMRLAHNKQIGLRALAAKSFKSTKVSFKKA